MYYTGLAHAICVTKNAELLLGFVRVLNVYSCLENVHQLRIVCGPRRTLVVD